MIILIVKRKGCDCMDYVGLKCGVCGEDFKENDDVVVCPDCGTPMHRICYKENNGCPNSEKHSENFVFEGFEKISESAKGASIDEEQNSASSKTGFVSENGEITCPLCGEKNKPGANFCNRCGSRFMRVSKDVDLDEFDPFREDGGMPQPVASAYGVDPLGGVPANSLFEENVTAADMACFVSVNTPYYLRAFDAVKRKLNKFNFSAAVFSGIWFLYRKQYKIGALVFSIEMLLYALRYYFSATYSMDVMKKIFGEIGLSVDQMSSLTMSQYTQLAEAMQKLPITEQLIMMIPSIMFCLQIAVMIVCGFIANKLYYKFSVKKISHIKDQAKDSPLDLAETAKSLYISGGVNPLAAGAFGLLYIFIMLL